MDLRVSLDGAAGLLLISLPWLVLAVAMWRGARRRQGRDEAEPARAGAAHEPLGVMMAPASDTTEPSAETSGAEEAVFVPVAEPPALSAREREEALLVEVEAAKAARDDAMLARSCVDLARMLVGRAERRQGATLLQTAALAARRAKLPGVHAEARIELAELALAEGDLTSACEHWQMAKLMFHETGRRADQDRMSDLMRQQRCPTDWVLTNF